MRYFLWSVVGCHVSGGCSVVGWYVSFSVTSNSVWSDKILLSSEIYALHCTWSIVYCLVLAYEV